MFNTQNRPRVYDDETWNNLGISPTTAFTPTLTSNGAGNLTGSYRYFLVPINKNHPTFDNNYTAGQPLGPYSPGSNPSSNKMDISGLPGSHTDSQVTHWRVFRNKAGAYVSGTEDDLNDYFFVTDIAIATTSSTGFDNVADDSLAGPRLTFRNNIPPTCKFVELYKDRLYACGFDPYTTGTVTVNGGDDTKIDLDSGTWPDGVVGCFFRKDGDDKKYIITAIDSDADQITLDESFSGALSAANYAIFRDTSAVFYSELYNPGGWGRSPERKRNRINVGGRERNLRLTGLIAHMDTLYMFTEDEIWGMRVSNRAEPTYPQLVHKGLGNVSESASQFAPVDGELYFMSIRGPARFTPGSGVELIGQQLGLDFTANMNPAQLALVAVGHEPKADSIWYAVPQANSTENDRVFAFHRPTATWWQFDHMHIAAFLKDQNGDGKPALFSASGKFVVEEWVGTRDGVSSDFEGNPTAGTTTTLTDSGASFTTTGSGLAERYVHVFKSDGTLRFSAQITSNTATVLTIPTQSTAPTTGDTYYLGSVYGFWRTPDFEVPQ